MSRTIGRHVPPRRLISCASDSSSSLDRATADDVEVCRQLERGCPANSTGRACNDRHGFRHGPESTALEARSGKLPASRCLASRDIVGWDDPADACALDFTDRPPRIRWGVVVLLFALATLLRFAYFYLDDLSRQIPGTFVRRLLEEGTGNVASALFFPLAVLLERYFPVDQGRWRRTWFVHVAGYIAYSAAHTTFIAVSRALLFPALGMRAYDYGICRRVTSWSRRRTS